jgi:hypothetical protein
MGLSRSVQELIGLIELRRTRWVGKVARIGGQTRSYRDFVGGPYVMRPLGRARHRW